MSCTSFLRDSLTLSTGCPLVTILSDLLALFLPIVSKFETPLNLNFKEKKTYLKYQWENVKNTVSKHRMSVSSSSAFSVPVSLMLLVYFEDQHYQSSNN